MCLAGCKRSGLNPSRCGRGRRSNAHPLSHLGCTHHVCGLVISPCWYSVERCTRAARLAGRAGLAEYVTPWALQLALERMVTVVTSRPCCREHSYVCERRVERPHAVELEAANTASPWAWALSMLSRYAMPSYAGLGWPRLGVWRRQKRLSWGIHAVPVKPRTLD